MEKVALLAQLRTWHGYWCLRATSGMPGVAWYVVVYILRFQHQISNTSGRVRCWEWPLRRGRLPCEFIHSCLTHILRERRPLGILYFVQDPRKSHDQCENPLGPLRSHQERFGVDRTPNDILAPAAAPSARRRRLSRPNIRPVHFHNATGL